MCIWEVMGLERGPLSLVITIGELLERESSGCGLESWEYGSGDPSRWPRDNLYPQNLALTSLTSGGSSVRIVRSRTQATVFQCSVMDYKWQLWRFMHFVFVTFIKLLEILNIFSSIVAVQLNMDSYNRWLIYLTANLPESRVLMHTAYWMKNCRFKCLIIRFLSSALYIIFLRVPSISDETATSSHISNLKKKAQSSIETLETTAWTMECQDHNINLDS
jgi:hypothetical protein